MIDGRSIIKGTLRYQAFASVNKHPDLDLRALRNTNGPAGQGFQRYTSPGAGGLGFIARHFTNDAERNAMLAAYQTTSHIDPENPSAGFAGDVPNGAIIYNRASNALEAYVNGGWVELAAAGSIPDMDDAYSQGNVVTLTAGKPFTLADGLTTAIQGVLINKTAAQGVGTVGRGVYNVLTASASDAAGYRGFEFLGSGASNAEGVRVTMDAAGDYAFRAVKGSALFADGSVTLSSGNLVLTSGNTTLSSGVYAQTSTATSAIHSITANSVSTLIGSTHTYNGLTTGIGQLVTSSGTIATSGILASFVASGLTTGKALSVVADGLTTGTLIYGESSSGGFAANGRFLKFYDGANAVFEVAGDGATTIKGTPSAAALTLTTGNLVISSGTLATSGDYTITDGKVDITQTDTADYALSILANGVRTQSALAIASNSSGAVNAFKVSASGTTSAAVVKVDVSAVATGAAFEAGYSAAATGAAFSASMGSNLAGNGLLVARSGVATGSSIKVTHAGATANVGKPDLDIDGTNGATTYEGARIRNAIVATATGRLLEIAQRGTGASTSNTLFSDAGTGSSATIAITGSAAKTGAAAAALSITPTAGADYRAILLDGTSAGTTFTALDVLGGAVARSTPLFDFQDSGTGTGAGFNYDVLGAGSYGVHKTTVGAVLFTGKAYELNMGSTAVGATAFSLSDNRIFTTGPAVDWQFSAAYTAHPAVKLTSAGNHQQPILSVQTSSTSSSANALKLATSGASAATLLSIDVAAGAAGSASALSINRSNIAHSTSLISVVDAGTGNSGSALNVSSSASTYTGGFVTFSLMSGVNASRGVQLNYTQNYDGAGSSVGQYLTITQASTNRTQGSLIGQIVALDGGAALTSTGGSFIGTQYSASNLDSNAGAVTNYYIDCAAATNLTNAIRIAQGGMLFTSAAQTIAWSDNFGAGLTVRSGQTLTIDVNGTSTGVAGGSGSVTVNNTTGLRTTGNCQITKTITLSAGAFKVSSGSGTSATTIPGFPTISSASDILECFYRLPNDFVAGNVTLGLEVAHTNEASATPDGGTLIMQYDLDKISDNAAGDGAFGLAAFGTLTGGNAGVVQRATVSGVTALNAASPGDVIRIVISRDTADTSTKAYAVLSFDLTYTSFTP
jgi:hypothetical protein